jgi:transcription elongation factor Elf1
MLAEYHDAGLCATSDGSIIRLRVPLRPRAPRYRCSGCGDEVTSNALAEHPGIYVVQCTGCGLVTRVVVKIPFFVVTS